jgi:hypothetical protein
MLLLLCALRALRALRWKGWPRMSKRTMRTIEVINFGEYQWDGPKHAARIERVRVLFSDRDRVSEMLKFCYLNDGRHARTHLTIDQDDFVELLKSAVENNVFRPEVIKELRKVLK